MPKATHNVETVTYAQFDKVIRDAQKAAIQEYGCSSSVSFDNDFIVEIYPDEKKIKLRSGWRDAARKRARCI